MCKAFSCIISKNKKVTWKLNIDRHEDLVELAGYEDNAIDSNRMTFAKVEIAPKNKDYLNPDEWVFEIDERITPEWFSPAHEQACWDAFKIYEKELYKIVIKGKKIIHQFHDIKGINKKEVTKTHIELLKKWFSVMNSVRDSVINSVGDSVRDSVRDSVINSVRDSVGDSVRDSVWDSVRDSVGDSVRDSVINSVRDSVWDSVRDSVWNSVRDSVGDSVRDSVINSVGDSVRDSVWNSVINSVRDSVINSVWAYASSFFKLNKWKYIKHKKGDNPYQCLIDLWEQGLVPSFDGETWRLHSGKKAKIVFEIKSKRLKKWRYR